MIKVLRILLVSFAFVVLIPEAQSAPSIHKSRVQFIFGRGVDAPSAVTDGVWVDRLNWQGSGSLIVSGSGTWIIQIRVSNQKLKPANTFDGQQMHEDITEEGTYNVGASTRWIKFQVTSWTSGTPVAEFFINQKGGGFYLTTDKDGNLKVTSGLPADASSATNQLLILDELETSTSSTPPGTIACTGTETSLGAVNLDRLELIVENISDETISIGATGIAHGSGFILAPGDVALDGLGEMIFIATTEELFCISDGSTENLTVSELNK